LATHPDAMLDGRHRLARATCSIRLRAKHY
jgi:hypothetical protein